MLKWFRQNYRYRTQNLTRGKAGSVGKRALHSAHLNLSPIAEKIEKHVVLHGQSDGKMSARDKSLSPPSTVIGAAAAAALAIILRTAAAGAARSIHLLHMIERDKAQGKEVK